MRLKDKQDLEDFESSREPGIRPEAPPTVRDNNLSILPNLKRFRHHDSC
jgi:hypothetical protein